MARRPGSRRCGIPRIDSGSLHAASAAWARGGGGRLRDERIQEALDPARLPLELDEDAAAVVAHIPGQPAALGQSIDEGTKAYSLHHAFDGDGAAPELFHVAARRVRVQGSCVSAAPQANSMVEDRRLEDGIKRAWAPQAQPAVALRHFEAPPGEPEVAAAAWKLIKVGRATATPG